MTNSGERILIQITFNVMNVRKPLLSSSSLEHRGVTLIFDHDYDRIILRNDDCHSYLPVILTNGIPPCKALVLAGENATNDFDEEVYDNDGDERNEAREASAGDRRAIADPDHAAQLDISGEAKTARLLRTPEPPTDAARMAHNATHVPFRFWCPICVASRGRSSLHRRVVVIKTADTLPKFQTDFLFIRTLAESETQPCITFVETRSGVVISFMCARKGGHADLITRVSLRRAEKLHANETPEQYYDLRQKQEQRVCRTMLPDKSRRILHTAFSNLTLAIPFAIRYAGFVFSGFTVRPDGRTPFQYLLGTPNVSPS